MPSVAVGEKAPAYRLRGLDNSYWTLGNPDERRSVVVVFFGRETAASRVLLPFVERIYRRAHANPTEVIGISIDSQQDTLEFASDYSFTFPILIDAPDLETVRSWGIVRQPVLYLLDRRLTATDVFEGWNKAAFERIAQHHLEEARALRKDIWEPGDAPVDALPPERIRTRGSS